MNPDLSSDVRRVFEKLYSESNHEQRTAVEHIAGDPSGESYKMPIIDGPPGTGKTRVAVLGGVCYILRRPKARWKCQVVFLTFSNSAAARVVEELKKCQVSYETAVYAIDPARPKPPGIEEYCLPYENISYLSRRDAYRLRNARFIVTTLHSAKKAFEVCTRPSVIIDEVSQVNKSLFFSALSESRKRGHDIEGISLVGDPNQLPIISHQEPLQMNIASYVMSKRQGLEPHRLVIQYRMNRGICELVNILRYGFGGHRLECAPEVENRILNEGSNFSGLLFQWPALTDILNPKKTCVLIDTSDLMGELGETSKYNPAEATLAFDLARLLAKAYPNASGMIITPYSEQKEIVSLECQKLQNKEAKIASSFTCCSIHETQGREYDWVILSLVRSNPQKYVGFLSRENALIYVGCSRAKCKLILLLSKSTFEIHDYFRDLLRFFKTDGNEYSVSYVADEVKNELKNL